MTTTSPTTARAFTDPESIRLANEPASAAMARDFVTERSSLDVMCHAEADLLVTELVGNVVRHAPDVDEFEVVLGHEAPRAEGCCPIR